MKRWASTNKNTNTESGQRRNSTAWPAISIFATKGKTMDLLSVGLILAVYLLLQLVILPKLGVPT